MVPLYMRGTNSGTSIECAWEYSRVTYTAGNSHGNVTEGAWSRHNFYDFVGLWPAQKEPEPPPKNWRWFHPFAEKIEQALDSAQVLLSESLHRVQEKMPPMQVARLKRREYLHQLRMA
jgi:hypothetical protein